MSSHLSFVEAIVVGAFQGASELFPVSSLGHSVIIPALIGGSWARDLNVSAPESPYLAFIVALHVATALALLVFFWRDWLRILGGFGTSLRNRSIRTADERLAWLIIVASIPVGITGLLLEHFFRTTLGKPMPAAAFLAVNGVILLGADRLMRGAARRNEAAASDVLAREPAVAMAGAAGAAEHAVHVGEEPTEAILSDRRLSRLSFKEAVVVGCAQILALLPGISRSGATMVAGLARGLSHEDAARFSFLLATPIILAAGLLKIPDLFGPLGTGIHGQALAGAAASFVTAYLTVRFLTRYFETRTLTPFGVYCLLAGIGSFIYLAVA
jgi:undecaprenyl-diphosphatase